MCKSNENLYLCRRNGKDAHARPFSSELEWLSLTRIFAPKFQKNMVKNVESLSTLQLKELAREQNIIGEHFTLILDSSAMPGLMKLGQPYRAPEGRMARIVRGSAIYRINLIDYQLREHDVVFMPPDTIVEIESLSEDYAVEVLVISGLPGVSREDAVQILPHDVILLSLADDDWQRTSGYIRLIADELRRESPVFTAASHLILALQSDMNSLWQRIEKSGTARHQSRAEEVFARFLALLREYGKTHRSIPFYAERLALTPNHLSAVVRQQSGLSVMDWINRTTIMEAKILLKHSTLMMYEIADRLCFSEPTAFNRYFKKQTGITPLEFREQREQS